MNLAKARRLSQAKAADIMLSHLRNRKFPARNFFNNDTSQDPASTFFWRALFPDYLNPPILRALKLRLKKERPNRIGRALRITPQRHSSFLIGIL